MGNYTSELTDLYEDLQRLIIKCKQLQAEVDMLGKRFDSIERANALLSARMDDSALVLREIDKRYRH